MLVPCDKTFLSVPKNLTLWPWPWLLTYYWKNLTLAITFEPKEIRLSYYTCWFLVTRPFISKILTLWPWRLTYFWKNLTLTMTFEPKVIGLKYYTYLFPVTRPLCWCQCFWPSGLDLDFDLLMEKLELVAAGGISPVRTDPDLVWLCCRRGHPYFTNTSSWNSKID